MSDELAGELRGEKAPECPHCGVSLFPYGALIKTWGLLEWVEAWHCPVHGAVIQGVKDDGDSKNP
jgi:hypothetical protein